MPNDAVVWGSVVPTDANVALDVHVCAFTAMDRKLCGCHPVHGTMPLWALLTTTLLLLSVHARCVPALFVCCFASFGCVVLPPLRRCIVVWLFSYHRNSTATCGGFVLPLLVALCVGSWVLLGVLSLIRVAMFLPLHAVLHPLRDRQAEPHQRHIPCHDSLDYKNCYFFTESCLQIGFQALFCSVCNIDIGWRECNR